MNLCFWTSCTSVQVWTVLWGVTRDVYGGAVPAHVGECLLAGLLNLPRRLDDGVHQLQVAATELGLGGHQARQYLAVLGLVDV